MSFLSLELQAAVPSMVQLRSSSTVTPSSCPQPPWGSRLPTPLCDVAPVQTCKKLKIEHQRAAGSPSLQFASRGGRKRQCERRASPPPPPQRERLRKHFWRGFRGVTPRGRVCGSGDVRPGGDVQKRREQRGGRENSPGRRLVVAASKLRATHTVRVEAMTDRGVCVCVCLCVCTSVQYSVLFSWLLSPPQHSNSARLFFF